MSSTLHPMLNVAVRAARAAGVIINRAALDVEAVRVAQKQANDFVTEVDQASEASIIETLLTAYPGHGILAEESGRAHGNAHSDHIWIIDPLDGTTNFIHGFPVYCVSIALQVAGRVEQAVIYDPARNDLFTATRGRGAFLNDRRIRVSKRAHLADCLLATGFPFRPGDDFPAYLQMMGDLMRITVGLRRPGAAALDLAYVAAGFSDGFFELGLKPWDMAAGSLLVTEAGGLVGNFAGDALQLEMPECLAANPRVYAQMVKVLGKYSQKLQPPSMLSLPLATGLTEEARESSDTLLPEKQAEEPGQPVAPADDEAPAQAAPAPSEKPAAPPRPRLRAAPRRAPEPEPVPERRYGRAARPAGRFSEQKSGDRPARFGQPAAAPDRERPYGKFAAQPAGKFGERNYGERNGGGRSASGDRPAFQNRPGRPAQARPFPGERRDDRAGGGYSTGPRREGSAPRGKPYAPSAPRSAAARSTRPYNAPDRAAGSGSRAAPRGKPYTPRAPRSDR